MSLGNTVCWKGREEEQEGTLQLQQECAKKQTRLDGAFGV